MHHTASMRANANYKTLKWTRHFNNLYLSDGDDEILTKALILCKRQETRLRPWFHIYMVEHYARSNYPKGMNELTVASYFGLVRLVYPLLDCDPTLVLSTDDYARSPLWWAARNGHGDTIRPLLDKLDLSIDNHRLAIERVFPVAVLSGDQEIVTVLLKTGLEMMSSLYVGWTALQWATATDHYDVVKTLLTREKNSETSMKRIEEALFLAVAKGHCAILQLFLEYRPDLEAKNENDETPLFLAVNKNHYDMAVLLLKQGANVNAVAQNGGNAIYMGKGEPVLHRAIRSAAMTATLLSYGADIDAKDAYGQTALYCAVAIGAEHTVDQLLANGADIMTKTLTGETPWYRAHLEGKKDIIKLMKMKYPGQETRAYDLHVRLFSHAELRAQKASLKTTIGESVSINLETLLEVLESEDGGSTHRDVSRTMRRIADENYLQHYLENTCYYL